METKSSYIFWFLFSSPLVHQLTSLFCQLFSPCDLMVQNRANHLVALFKKMILTVFLCPRHALCALQLPIKPQVSVSVASNSTSVWTSVWILYATYDNMASTALLNMKPLGCHWKVITCETLLSEIMSCLMLEIGVWIVSGCVCMICYHHGSKKVDETWCAIHHLAA